MSPRTADQFKEMRESRKARIMKAALHLFANRGFHNTSIAAIAQESGMSKGLLYNYFDSKEHLISEIIMQGLETLLSVFMPEKKEVTTDEEMISIIRRYLEVIKKDVPYWKLYFSMFTQPAIYALVESWFMEKVEPLFLVLSNYFERKGYESPMVEARLFAALLDGITFNFVFDPEHFPIDQILDRFLNLYRFNSNT